MNHSDQRPTLWTEAAVEELLTDIFHSEMPPALKTLRSEPVEPRRAASGLQLAALLVAALSVLAVFIALDQSPVSRQRGGTASLTDAANEPEYEDSRRANGTRKAAGVPEESGRGYLVGTSAAEAGGDDAIGPKPVEQQGELSWTELRLHDPAVGREAGTLPPELMIEIYPIEGARQPELQPRQ